MPAFEWRIWDVGFWIFSGRKLQSGFTLIELLLVIGLFTILTTIVTVAINPARQLAQSRNAQRIADIRSLLDAFQQYAIDRGGRFQNPSSPLPADCTIPLAPAAARKVCLPSVSLAACDFGAPDDGDGCAYSAELVPAYVVTIPQDPQDVRGGDDDLQADYTIVLTSDSKRASVQAPGTEIPPETDVLSVSR